MYEEVDTQFSERSSNEPDIHWLPSTIADEAHYACALVILQQTPVTSTEYSGNCTQYSGGSAQSVSLKDRAATWNWPNWEHVRSEAKTFSWVYIAIILYWAFRLFHDGGAFLMSYALDRKAVSSAQEWYDRYIAPAATDCKEHSQTCDSEEETQYAEQLEPAYLAYLL